MATRFERLRFSHGASIQGLAYSPDGTKLASTGSRWGMVWNLNPQSTKPLSEAEAWAGLASSDGRVGLASIRHYADHPDEAVRRIRADVKPIASPDRQKIAGWIEQLGSDDFQERQEADRQLTGVADAARDELVAAFKKAESPEIHRHLVRILSTTGDERTLAGEPLRAMRAVEVLEAIRTPAAKEMLKSLSGGAAGSRLTRAADEALIRLRTK